MASPDCPSKWANRSSTDGDAFQLLSKEPTAEMEDLIA